MTSIWFGCRFGTSCAANAELATHSAGRPQIDLGQVATAVVQGHIDQERLPKEAEIDIANPPEVSTKSPPALKVPHGRPPKPNINADSYPPNSPNKMGPPQAPTLNTFLHYGLEFGMANLPGYSSHRSELENRILL